MIHELSQYLQEGSLQFQRGRVDRDGDEGCTPEWTRLWAGSHTLPV